MRIRTLLLMKVVLRWSLLVCILLAAVSCDRRSRTDRLLCDALRTGDTNYIKRYLVSGGDINGFVHPDPSYMIGAPLLDVTIEYGRKRHLDSCLGVGPILTAVIRLAIRH